MTEFYGGTNLMKKIILAALALTTSLACASALTLYPANGATGAAYDAQLVVTFDSAAQITAETKVEILDSNGNVVDTILAADEVQNFADGAKVNVGAQLIRAEGNSVYITPHNGKILPSSSYSVNFEGAGEWKFETKAAPSLFADGATITVNNSIAQENSADFHSIQGALDAAAASKGTYTISLAAGTYYELLHYNAESNIILQGPKGNNRGDNCVIQYINCNDLNAGQKERVSFYFNASKANLVIENVTLINAADGEKVYSSAVQYASGNAQAETIFFHNGKGHTLVANNASFKGHQDTMQISGKCWFYNCYVEGDVDYVWGYVDVALFENCDFNCVRYVKDRAYLFECRVGSKEEPLVPKGFVLYNSTVNVEERQTAFFARRATAVEKAKIPYYDQCAIVNVKFKGPGNFNPMSYYVGKAPQFEGDCTNVGWKSYNVNFDELKGTKPTKETASKRYKDSAELNKKLYKAEYANRNLIMNRVYNKDTGKYENDAKYAWDLNKVIAERGYKIKPVK